MMAVSDETFPPRKRRPPAGAFISPNLSHHKLIQYLLLLSQHISNLQPLSPILKRNSTSIIGKAKFLLVLFEELIRDTVRPRFPPSALLCFEELYVLLQRIKTLIEDCSNGSKTWLLMQHESVSNSFHELTTELSTLLDIFPLRDLKLSEDVTELVVLIRKQCSPTMPFVDPVDQKLRDDVLRLLDTIRREIVPEYSELEKIFNRLRLQDSSSCSDEIESLEEEVQNQNDDGSKSSVIALIGLVRYARCVLYGASTPRINDSRRAKSLSEMSFPTDFRCPISLDLMTDPVVVSTGQTYDRGSINLWIESGHNTCPKTGQTLVHMELIPNFALKNLIVLWCREQKIPFESTDTNQSSKMVLTNKTAFEATKMTVTFLINKLAVSQSWETANRVVHELRALAKTDSDNRACIAEAGGLPLLVRFVGSDHPNLQVNAVTTILNLSVLEANKTRIMETEGVLNGVIEVLRTGATWEAKGKAAATIFSLTGAHAYRRKLGRKTRVVKGLMDLARDGPTSWKRDALLAILNLAGDRETVGKLIEVGVVEMASDVMNELSEEAVTVIEVVVKKGGLAAIAATYHVIKKLAAVLREGTDRAQESAAATLVNICRKGGSEVVAELAGITGIERIIWELMGMGTGRGKRKAARLLKILRRWAAGLNDNNSVTATYSVTTTNVTPTRIVLPGPDR